MYIQDNELGTSFKNRNSIRQSLRLPILRSSNTLQDDGRPGELRIDSVHAGRTHSYVVINGRVIGFGLDNFGKMGIGNQNEALVTPTIIPFFDVRFTETR